MDFALGGLLLSTIGSSSQGRQNGKAKPLLFDSFDRQPLLLSGPLLNFLNRVNPFMHGGGSVHARGLQLRNKAMFPAHPY